MTENRNSENWTDFEKYLIARIDTLEKTVSEIKVNRAGQSNVTNILISSITSALTSVTTIIVALITVKRI